MVKAPACTVDVGTTRGLPYSTLPHPSPSLLWSFRSCRRRSTSERFGRHRGPGKACRRDRKGSEPAEELATLPSVRTPQRHRHDLGSKRVNSNLSRALCHHSRGAKLSSQSSAPRFQASSLAQIDPVSLRPAHVEVSPPRATSSVGAVECPKYHCQWIAVGHCTIADYALYPYTRLADESGFNLNEFPSVERWLEQIEAEAGYIPIRTDGRWRRVVLLSISKLVRSASKRASVLTQKFAT